MVATSIARQRTAARTRKGIPLKLAAHDTANAEAARIIFAEPELYPPGSGLATWARHALRRLNADHDQSSAPPAPRDPQPRLFEEMSE